MAPQPLAGQGKGIFRPEVHHRALEILGPTARPHTDKTRQRTQGRSVSAQHPLFGPDRSQQTGKHQFFFPMDAAAAPAFLFLKRLVFFGLHTTSEALRSDGLHQFQQLQFDPFNPAVFLILFDLAQPA